MRNYLQGKFTPTNPHKYIGDITNIFYRSSWEKKFLIWCDKNPAVIKYASEENVIPYVSPIDQKIHRYFVDAMILLKDRDGNLKRILIEIKPSKQTRPPDVPKRNSKRYLEESMTYAINIAKWTAAKDYCNRIGAEFVILTEKELGIK